MIRMKKPGDPQDLPFIPGQSHSKKVYDLKIWDVCHIKQLNKRILSHYSSLLCDKIHDYFPKLSAICHYAVPKIMRGQHSRAAHTMKKISDLHNLNRSKVKQRSWSPTALRKHSPWYSLHCTYPLAKFRRSRTSKVFPKKADTNNLGGNG
jgi:hypothetical protein